jgi:hypothetical protein
VYAKTIGAVFTKEPLLNYRNRRKLSDTVLFKKNYKRFEINSPWNYTRYYIYPTDTILPYSLYKEVEKDYHGRIERIDSYDKKKDIFVTLQLIPRKNWDDTAKEIFEFNHFVKTEKVSDKEILSPFVEDISVEEGNKNELIVFKNIKTKNRFGTFEVE